VIISQDDELIIEKLDSDRSGLTYWHEW